MDLNVEFWVLLFITTFPLATRLIMPDRKFRTLVRIGYYSIQYEVQYGQLPYIICWIHL
jgi:hypothetical protein